MNNTELESKVQQWFVDRNLHEANPVKQFLKLMEESGELFEGIAKDKPELIYDALGDIQVVLIGFEQQINNGAQISANQQELELLLMVSSLGNIAQKLYAHICHNETQTPLIKSDLMFLDSVINSVSIFNGTNTENCLQIAYDAIKDRKGKMIDGVFVKEEDLNND
nr:MAG TPA: NTP-PPase-like protein [Caudoviricetes sp.]